MTVLKSRGRAKGAKRPSQRTSVEQRTEFAPLHGVRSATCVREDAEQPSARERLCPVVNGGRRNYALATAVRQRSRCSARTESDICGRKRFSSRQARVMSAVDFHTPAPN